MKRNSTKRNLAQAGVTLIEMLVVVTIIALFAAVVGPKLLGRADEAKKVAARQQIQQFGQALGMYKLDTGQFPSSEQGLGALRLHLPTSINGMVPICRPTFQPTHGAFNSSINSPVIMATSPT